MHFHTTLDTEFFCNMLLPHDINDFIFLPVDTRVCGRDGRREFRYVPVLQDSNLARTHRGAQALRPDHTRR